MKRIIIILILAASCLSIKAQEKRHLTIIHLNDTHSHLDPLRGGDDAGNTGVIERAAFMDSVRVADGKRNVLLLHAGDFNQGSSYFTLLGGKLEIDLVNALKYDCITLGNHEFDNGVEDLAQRLSKLKCPVVCANYDFSENELGKYVMPYTIIRKAGMKIGIIGALADIRKLVLRKTADKLKALDTIETVNMYADKLKNEEGCDLVIVLSHLGYSMKKDVCDLSLAAQSKNIDIIVGGHSHTKLKKPAIVKDLDGKDVTIVQNWCWGYTMGVMHVEK